MRSILTLRTSPASLGKLTTFSFLAFLPPLWMSCQSEKALATGQYAVADAEYSQDNYDLRRDFRGDGSFTEAHSLSNCLLMEMRGQWVQKSDELKLQYTESRQRTSCKAELPGFGPDSAQLMIPIRHVEDKSFESFLTASGGKPEKWLRWNREG